MSHLISERTKRYHGTSSPTEGGYQANEVSSSNAAVDPQSIKVRYRAFLTQDESYTNASQSTQSMNPHTVSSTASHQHQQEQELLSEYTVPNPPISTKQSNAVAAEQDLISGGTSEQPRTLWMGDLDSWLDENKLQIFGGTC